VSFTSAETYWSQKIFRYCPLTTLEAEITAARAVARVNGRLASKTPPDCVDTNTRMTMRNRRISEQSVEKSVDKSRWPRRRCGSLLRKVLVAMAIGERGPLANLSWPVQAQTPTPPIASQLELTSEARDDRQHLFADGTVIREPVSQLKLVGDCEPPSPGRH